jgi:hypothetical protein
MEGRDGGGSVMFNPTVITLTERIEENSATELLAKVTTTHALSAHITISGEEQTIFFRQDETGSYQTIRRVENKPLSEEKTCDRATALSLLNSLPDADAFHVEYGPVKEIWPKSNVEGNR